jgi:hypothetical protein
MWLQKLHPHTATILYYTTTILYNYYIMLKIFTRLGDKVGGRICQRNLNKIQKQISLFLNTRHNLILEQILRS